MDVRDVSNNWNSRNWRDARNSKDPSKNIDESNSRDYNNSRNTSKHRTLETVGMRPIAGTSARVKTNAIDGTPAATGHHK
jgi:hypothetical protein